MRQKFVTCKAFHVHVILCQYNVVGKSKNNILPKKGLIFKRIELLSTVMSHIP